MNKLIIAICLSVGLVLVATQTKPGSSEEGQGGKRHNGGGEVGHHKGGHHGGHHRRSTTTTTTFPVQPDFNVDGRVKRDANDAAPLDGSSRRPHHSGEHDGQHKGGKGHHGGHRRHSTTTAFPVQPNFNIDGRVKRDLNDAAPLDGSSRRPHHSGEHDGQRKGGKGHHGGHRRHSTTTAFPVQPNFNIDGRVKRDLNDAAPLDGSSRRPHHSGEHDGQRKGGKGHHGGHRRHSTTTAFPVQPNFNIDGRVKRDLNNAAPLDGSSRRPHHSREHGGQHKGGKGHHGGHHRHSTTTAFPVQPDFNVDGRVKRDVNDAAPLNGSSHRPHHSGEHGGQHKGGKGHHGGHRRHSTTTAFPVQPDFNVDGRVKRDVNDAAPLDGSSRRPHHSGEHGGQHKGGKGHHGGQHRRSTTTTAFPIQPDFNVDGRVKRDANDAAPLDSFSRRPHHSGEHGGHHKGGKHGGHHRRSTTTTSFPVLPDGRVKRDVNDLPPVDGSSRRPHHSGEHEGHHKGKGIRGDHFHHHSTTASPAIQIQPL